MDCLSWRCTESQAQQQIEGQFHPGDEGREASALNIIDEFTCGARVSHI